LNPAISAANYASFKTLYMKKVPGIVDTDISPKEIVDTVDRVLPQYLIGPSRMNRPEGQREIPFGIPALRPMSGGLSGMFEIPGTSPTHIFND